MQRSDFEIMAPVGSRESLFAAFQAGADAVYFGVGALNMRSHSSSSFGLDDLKEIATLCRDHHVESYLTVNTVIYDDDMSAMREMIDAAKTAGISAVIAADVAVMQYCRQVGMSVHLSPQLNISNIAALRFYSQFADVVVLARELNLDQVAEISRAIRQEGICGPSGELVRIEMFCHGALCLAVSGKCFMSLATRGKSANRGGCLQTCRRAYLVKDKDRDIELEVDNEYIMSPKDLKTLGFIDRMIDAGVRVFKIEGRARGPEYVRTVVECYDRALEAVIAGDFNDAVKADCEQRLAKVFNRGFWDGYYLGAPVAELTDGYGSKATEVKTYVGTCVKYFAKAKVGEFIIQAASFRLGDRLLVTGPSTGAVFVQPQTVLADGVSVDEIHKGMDITFKVDEKIRENDKLYVMRTVQR